jgi:PAS domain S-box-containing protein
MRVTVEETETEDLFETLANESPVGLCIIQDGKFCYTNPTFQHNTGYREDELLGRDSLELVVPEDRERVRENAIKTLKGELTLPYQIRVTHKNGSVRWVMESVVSIQYCGRRATLGYFVDITEHKQMEEALQAEKNKLQALVGAIEDGISIQDRDYNVIYQNGSMIKAYGYHLGKKCYQAYEVKKKVCDGCPVKKAFKDGKPHTSERRVVLPSGETLFMENTANPIRDARGDVVSCLEIVRNITERKQAEEALRQSREELRKMFESVTDGIMVTDFKGVITEANQGTMEMHGFASKDELVGRNALKLVAPRDRERMTNSMREALKQGTVRGVEHTLLKADGSEFPAELSTSVLKDASGNAVAHITIVRDITERKRMEESLRDSEEKLRKIFESVTDGISVIDLKGRITEVNQRAVEMHGFSSKDRLLGKSAFELVAPRDHEKITANMKKAIKQGAIIGVEYTLLKADGSEFPGELSTSALKDASGNVLGHITIVRDITERKRAEEEREALLQDITKSNQKLEAANKELQDFVYVASHDLREPLRKISSFGTLLQDSLKGKLDEDQQENFEFMIDGAQRMQDMIDDLLTYSRLTTRAKPPQQVFLNEVIENLKKLELATLLEETGGTIHIPEPLPPVQADPIQMNQLFQNLIGNGLKFHKEGIPPEITIRAHGVENKMIRIEVEDNGIGIDEQYHEQLFVMFKRLHSRAQYEGTGIGLAVCKKIVERHGGNIGVKSTPGKGSTFWFTLPRGSYIKES